MAFKTKSMSGKKSRGIEKNVEFASKIYKDYGDYIYRIIYNKIKKKDRAEDLYHDFFLSLVRKPFPPDVKNIKSYLYKAITRDIFDATLRTQRYRELMKKYADNSLSFINNSDSVTAYIVEEKADKIFRFARGSLTLPEAKAIILKFKKNWSNEEIAKNLGVKKESVSRYISVGLKKIRQKFTAARNKKNE